MPEQLKKNKFLRLGLVAALLMLVVALTGSLSGAEDYEIVYVDIEQVLEVHPVMGEIEQDFQTGQQEIYQDIEKKFVDSGEDESQAQTLLNERNMRIQQLEVELMNKAYEQVRKDSAEIADDLGYEYVLTEESIILGGEDITDLVIAEMEEAE